jgi:hypothetical protein
MRTLLSIIILLACSCSTRRATLPDGRVLYESTRIGTKEQVKHVEFRSASGDVFIMDGYASDGVEALGIVTEAAVRGAVGSVVPSPLAGAGQRGIPAGFKLVPKDDPSTAKPEIE